MKGSLVGIATEGRLISFRQACLSILRQCTDMGEWCNGVGLCVFWFLEKNILLRYLGLRVRQVVYP